MQQQNEQQGMHKRRITLEDGRYMIFYTFDETPLSQTETQKTESAGEKRESEAEPQAEDERSV